MNTKLNLKQKLLWAGIFGIAMGYFEAALVVYVRELFYPEGFTFPLKDIPARLLNIELGREVASILMLLAVARLLGSCFIDRFAGFGYMFGVWDITYYLFLKLFENWPSSFFTVDILFLIPVPWIGPVWAPVLVSVALIWSACVIWRKLENGIEIRPKCLEWWLEIIAGLTVIGSFLVGAPAALMKEPLPVFPWYLWLSGMALGIVTFIRTIQRSNKIESP